MAGNLDPDVLFSAQDAAPEGDLDDLFSSLPDAPVTRGAGGGAATALFMEAIGSDSPVDSGEFNLFGDVPEPAPASAAAAPVNAGTEDLDNLFAGGLDSGDGLSDLFGADGSPAPAGNNSATDLFASAVGGSGAEDLFGSTASLPDDDGIDDLFGDSPTSNVPAADGGLGDLFASAEGDLAGLTAGGSGEVAPPVPGMVTGILSPGSAEEDLADLFGSTGAVDPDQLFQSTGATGTQSAVSAGADQSLDDLFTSGGGGPVGADDDLDDLFSGGGVPSTEAHGIPTGVHELPDDDGLGDLFGVAAGAGLPGNDMTIDVSGSLAGFSAPTGEQAADALFGDGPMIDGDFSSVGFAAPGAATDDATIDVSASFANGTAPPADDGLDDLFGMAGPGAASENLSIETGLAEFDAPGDQAAQTVQELMESGQDDSVPYVQGLESGDLLQEAHDVADAGGQAVQSTDELTETEDPGGPRPANRRQKRRKPQFYPVAPTPSLPARSAAFGGLAGASALLAGALVNHPMVAGIGVGVLAPCLTLGAGLVYVGAYALAKVRIPTEVLARSLALGAVGVAATQVTPAVLATGGYAWASLASIAFGVGAILESGLLFLSLRISLAIVVVYSSISLIHGLAEGTPYKEIVARRLLENPTLAQQLSPDQLDLALRAFDPLFVAVNFFLPVVVVVSLLQLLADARKRWWGLAFSRLATAVVTGLSVYLNLGLYRANQVPNLLSLMGR